MFPVTILSEGMTVNDLPEGNQYVVAQDGVYLLEEMGVIRSCTRIPHIPHLASVTPFASLLMPKIPADVAYRALSFFRKVWTTMRSECEVQVYASPEEEKFLLICPQQYVTGSSVSYLRETTEKLAGPGYLRVGTIHSHCDFSAFHSTTDLGDERTEDGLHITFGHVNQGRISIESSINIRDNRFGLDPLEVIEGLTGSKTEKYLLHTPQISHDDVDRECNEWLGNCTHGYRSFPNG